MANEQRTITPELIKKAGVLLKQEHTQRLLLEKQASEHVREKKAQELAFREVELGLCEPFKCNEDFQQKVASLLEDDLTIVEKALDRGYHKAGKQGELVNDSDAKQKDPFTQYILTGEME